MHVRTVPVHVQHRCIAASNLRIGLAQRNGDGGVGFGLCGGADGATHQTAQHASGPRTERVEQLRRQLDHDDVLRVAGTRHQRQRFLGRCHRRFEKVRSPISSPARWVMR